MGRRPRRRYDDKFRAGAVVMLEAAGYPDKKGALTYTANHLRVPRSTLQGWFNASRNPPPPELRYEKGLDMVQALRDELAAALSATGNVRIDASWKDLITGVGIMVDKLQLLTGQPTESTRSQIEVIRHGDDTDTFTGQAPWAERGRGQQATLQRPGHGPEVGQNGSGHGAVH